MRRYNFSDLDQHLLEVPEIVPVERPAWAGPERPGDEFNRMFSEQEVLSWLDFTFEHKDSQGEHYTRPGKSTREGSSATVYSDAEGTHVTIWSDTVVSMWPALSVRRPYDAFGLFVCTYHAGDYREATKQLNEEGFGTLPELEYDDILDDIFASIEAEQRVEEVGEAEYDAERSGWEPVDNLKILDGEEEPAPEVLSRSDGIFMLYKGKVHGFYGEPESMKSWAGQLAVVQTLNNGGSALILDFENSARSDFTRLQALGATRDEILAGLVAINPSGPMTLEARTTLGKVIQQKFDIILVDGVTDAMTLMGLDPEKNKDASLFDHQLLRPLARSGAAVVVVDHVTKDKEGRGRWAIGAQHKQAAITGAAFMFEVVQPFGIGMTGVAKVLIKKDKGAHLRKDSVGEHFADLRMASNELTGAITAALTPPEARDDPNWMPTNIMDRLSRYIEANPGMAKESVITGAGLTTAKKDWVELGFEKLVSRGNITDSLGDKRYRIIKPFSELEATMEMRGDSPPVVAPAVKSALDDDVSGPSTAVTPPASPPPVSPPLVDRWEEPAIDPQDELDALVAAGPPGPLSSRRTETQINDSMEAVRRAARRNGLFLEDDDDDPTIDGVGFFGAAVESPDDMEPGIYEDDLL